MYYKVFFQVKIRRFRGKNGQNCDENLTENTVRFKCMFLYQSFVENTFFGILFSLVVAGNKNRKQFNELQM